MMVVRKPPRGLVAVRSCAPSRTLGVRIGEEQRAAGEAEVPEGCLAVMEVRFAPFGTWYEISDPWEGTFMERTVPGAFKKTLAENRSMRCMFNHGHDGLIGQKLLGVPSRMAEDDAGPYMHVPLWDTSYNRDLLPGIRSGAYGSSFAFEALQETWVDAPAPSEYNQRGLPERTIREVRCREAGPVSWPANPAAGVGVMRSETEQFYNSLERSDPGLVRGLRERFLPAPSQAAGGGSSRAASGTRVFSAADRRTVLGSIMR